MESLWNLLYLLEPANVTLILTAVAVTFGSAFRALNHGKEMEKNRGLSKAPIMLDRSQALMFPVMGSCCLLLLFYLFSTVSQFLTAFIAVSAASSLFFWFYPYIALADPFVSRYCSKSFMGMEAFLRLACIVTIGAWLVSGHWILNNVLGISFCITAVSRIRLPNIKVSAILFAGLFVYDIFWVSFSESFFGANVMLSVGSQQASNPVHTVADNLSLPGLQLITKSLELPVKIVFPGNLLGSSIPGEYADEALALGLGDMAIPAMLLALVLCFDYRNSRGPVTLSELYSSKGHKYIWYALPGYAVGLFTASAAVVLTDSPQPALLYLVPCILGPVIVISWIRKELGELWESCPIPMIKVRR